MILEVFRSNGPHLREIYEHDYRRGAESRLDVYVGSGMVVLFKRSLSCLSRVIFRAVEMHVSNHSPSNQNALVGVCIRT